MGADSFHLHPKFSIAGAGQTGNRGEADLAVGLFGKDRPSIPQIVCEFKDVSSGLDAPQNRITLNLLFLFRHGAGILIKPGLTLRYHLAQSFGQRGVVV